MNKEDDIEVMLFVIAYLIAVLESSYIFWFIEPFPIAYILVVLVILGLAFIAKK